MERNKSLQALLPFWDPSEIPDFPFVYICAARRSGKTTLVKHLLLNYFQNYDIVTGICGNWHTAREYTSSGAIVEKYCHGKYDAKILKGWFRKCDELLQKGKELPRQLIVLDDILVSHAVKNETRRTSNDPYLTRLATQGRHYKCGVLLISQSWATSLNFARNSDIVLVAPTSLYAGNDFESLLKNYMSGSHKKTNKQILELFKRHDFLVLRYYKASRDQNQLLSWFRVRPS